MQASDFGFGESILLDKFRELYSRLIVERRLIRRLLENMLETEFKGDQETQGSDLATVLRTQARHAQNRG